MADVWKFKEDAEAGYKSLESQRDKLIEIMESEFGLPEKLLKMRALLRSEVEKIRYAVTREEKNELILNYILQTGKHQDLIKALSESFQTHLVNYINSNGVYRSEFGQDWPLAERELNILNDNEEHLIDILDTCELLPKLCFKQVINVKQRNFISSRTPDQARNEALLGIIGRLSRASYLTLIQCLKESHQGHIADILENGGALVAVHATLETDNLDETETQIVDEVTNLLLQRNVSTEQANRVLSAVQLNIIAVRRGQSLVIYICCSTEDELVHVCKMIDNSEMKNFLQQLFDSLTHNTNFKVLLVKIHESDVNKATQIFQRMKELKNMATKDDSTFTSKGDSTSSPTPGKNPNFRNSFVTTWSGIGNYSTERYRQKLIDQRPVSIKANTISDSVPRTKTTIGDRSFRVNDPISETRCPLILETYPIFPAKLFLHL